MALSESKVTRFMIDASINWETNVTCDCFRHSNLIKAVKYQRTSCDIYPNLYQTYTYLIIYFHILVECFPKRNDIFAVHNRVFEKVKIKLLMVNF